MRALLLALAAWVAASSSQATTLYATTTGVAPSGSGLYSVNVTTGASQFIDDAGGLLWEDIAGRAGDATHLYGVQRSGLVNHVSTIDVANGDVVELFSFVPADFGLAEGDILELTGISIAPSQPSIATITAFTLDASTFGSTNLVFDLDLGTGAFSNL